MRFLVFHPQYSLLCIYNISYYIMQISGFTVSILIMSPSTEIIRWPIVTQNNVVIRVYMEMSIKMGVHQDVYFVWFRGWWKNFHVTLYEFNKIDLEFWTSETHYPCQPFTKTKQNIVSKLLNWWKMLINY